MKLTKCKILSTFSNLKMSRCIPFQIGMFVVCVQLFGCCGESELRQQREKSINEEGILAYLLRRASPAAVAADDDRGASPMGEGELTTTTCQSMTIEPQQAAVAAGTSHKYNAVFDFGLVPQVGNQSHTPSLLSLSLSTCRLSLIL